MLECQMGDGGGAQEEPYMSVRSAHVRSGNPRTGNGPSGLAVPAPVSETPTHVPLEAEDAPNPGRGSSGDETNPHGSPPNQEEDYLVVQPDESASEEETHTESSEEESTHDPQINQRNRTNRNTPKTRPNIKIASLNMRGRQKENKDKMRMVIDWLRMNNVAILALQETHIMEDTINDLNTKYRHLKFFGSGLTTSSGGILFIVSERAGTPLDLGFKVFEKGRSGILNLKYENQELNVVNVYMPNHKALQKEALENLTRELRNYRNITDTELIILGDWNFVEDKIDRSPQHDDDRRVTREMTNLKATYDLIDGWREANPESRSFTWEGTTGNERRKIFSRIDRIYITRNTWEVTNEYKIINCDISDHDGVSVNIIDATAPPVGKGEQKLNLNIVNHPIFKKEAERLINKLEKQIQGYKRKEGRTKNPEEIQNLRTRHSPQKSWYEYKKGILGASILAMQKRREELLRVRRQTEKNIKKAERELRNCEPEHEETCRKSLSQNKKTMNDYDEKARNKRTYLNEAKWFRVNEKMSKQWFSLNRPKVTNSTIKSLFKTETEEETTDPEELLEIARHHHSQLQKEPPMDRAREAAINEILSTLSKELEDKDIKEIGKDITYREVNETLRKTPNGKAPGPDGIPNEFWKIEIKWRDKQKRENNQQTETTRETIAKTRPCIAAMMTKVFQDIEQHGPIDTQFSEARMGLLYKKKDKREIQNYRPITLLNTDYKIYTKTIANRLRIVAPKLIHKDQAGFMPKRSIYDQTKIVELMIKWCDNTKNKGIIVCLDQEKAYDRIDLNYLWKTLEKFKFPESFITKVKNLYKQASTAIRVNGFVSNLFEIRRGVRQGDPMSCLLYNLAIEPLIERIRASPLKGFRVSPDLNRVLVKVYADDTTVFLGPEDNPKNLQECLDIFCTASTARFNNLKTEIIPLGSKENRLELIRSRKYNNWEIEEEIHIAQEGEATRILGSWQGNGINIQSKWNDMIEKQLKTMRRWKIHHPSVAGRILISKALVISLAYYLMTVNGIPRTTLMTMEKNIRNFIWNGKRGQLAWERAILPVKEGGLGAPSLKIRYEAIKVGWLKRWWRPIPDRPDWAWVANELVFQCAQQKPTVARPTVKEWICQTWPIKIRSELIPKSLREMIEAAQKYNATISVMRAPKSSD